MISGRNSKNIQLVWLIVTVIMLVIMGTLFLQWQRAGSPVLTESIIETQFSIPPDLLEENSILPALSVTYSTEALEDMLPAVTGLEIFPEPLIGTDDTAPELPELIEEELSETIIEEEEEESVTVLDINEAIDSFVSERQNELTQDYVASCLRLRNSGGQASECPENELAAMSTYDSEKETAERIFADVTRKNRFAHLSRTFLMENETLLGIMDELSDADELAKEQAGIRLSLNNQYIAYLNGNPSPQVAAHNAMFGFVNNYTQVFVGRPYQFICAEYPCIYEYTGFRITRPEGYGESEYEFKETTPLFLPSR